MLPIPSNVLVFFVSEVVGCCCYFLFILLLSRSKQSFLDSTFFKLFISTGYAGIGVISTNWLIQLTTYLPVQRESAMLVYVAQISNGSATFCYTIGKLLIVLNRVTVLLSVETMSMWRPRTTFVAIFCQYVLPLIAHFYFAIAPLNWVDGVYKGLDNTTGSIYRSITGTFYVIYAIVGVTLNMIVIRRLRKLASQLYTQRLFLIFHVQSISSASFYKQQKSLAIYTITSTMTHLLFALHQFAWTYSFIVGDRDIQLSVRSLKPFVYGCTIFVDPIVLLILSSQVRGVFRKLMLRAIHFPPTNIHNSITMRTI